MRRSPKLDLERRPADLFQQRLVDLDELAVVVVGEELGRKPVGAGQAALAFDRLDDQQLVGDLEHLGVERRPLRRHCAEQLGRGGDAGDALVEQVRLLEEADRLVAELGLQRGPPALVLFRAPDVGLPAARGQLLGVAGGVDQLEVLELAAQQQLLQFGLALQVGLLVALLDPVERRFGDVDVAGVDQLRHLPVEEGEDQGADVGAVDVGVGRHHDLVVPGALDVELVVDAGPDRRDQRLDLVVGEDLVDAALLDVDDLAAQRQHRLGVAVAGLLGGAAGGIALDHEDLGQARVLDRAVGELARQGRVLQRRLAGQVAGLARRGACPRGVDRLADQRRASAGFSSRYSPSLRLTVSSTRPRIGGLPSLVLVWPSNCGSWSLTEITAVRPSRTSSPARLSSFSFSRPLLRA